MPITQLVERFHIEKARRGFDADSRADIYAQIGAKLENGGDLQVLISTLANSAERFTPDSATAFVLRYWTMRMSIGISFAKVVREHDFVPSAEVLLIAAGADAGKLPDTLRVASTMLDTQGELKEVYITAGFMPVVLIAGAIGVSAYFGTSVIPAAISNYDKTLFTGKAAALIQYSDFLLSPGGFITGAALICSVVWVVWSLPRALGEGGFRIFLEKYPPWSMYKELQGYAFLSTLAALLSVYAHRDALIYMCGDKEGDWQPTPYLLQRLRGAVGAFNGQGAANVADALDKAGYNFPSANILSLLYEYADAPDFAAAIQQQAERLRERMMRQAKKQGRKLNLYGYLVSFGLLMAMFAGFFDLIDQIRVVSGR